MADNWQNVKKKKKKKKKNASNIIFTTNFLLIGIESFLENSGPTYSLQWST